MAAVALAAIVLLIYFTFLAMFGELVISNIKSKYYDLAAISFVMVLVLLLVPVALFGAR